MLFFNINENVNNYMFDFRSPNFLFIECFWYRKQKKKLTIIKIINHPQNSWYLLLTNTVKLEHIVFYNFKMFLIKWTDAVFLTLCF